MGRPPIQHHKLIFDLPEEFLAKFGENTLTDGMPKGRVIGAALTAAGTYGMFRLIAVIGKEAVLRGTAGIFTEVSVPVINFFIGLFGAQVVPGEAPTIGISTDLEEFTKFDPFAFGMAVIAGGMVLAGQNPLTGVAAILDALIPL